MFTIFISVSAYFYPNRDVDSIYESYWSFGGISLKKSYFEVSFFTVYQYKYRVQFSAVYLIKNIY